MTSDEFKTDALRTEAIPENLNFSSGGLLLMLELGTQVAKLMDSVKKTLIYAKPFDDAKFRADIEAIEGNLITLRNRSGSIALRDYGSNGLHEPNVRIAHGAIGMFGEAGEILEALAKFMRSGDLDITNVAEETGDSDWYKMLIHDESGVSEEQSRAKVIAKLKARYGEKFSTEAALNRDLTAERAALEGTAQ